MPTADLLPKAGGLRQPSQGLCHGASPHDLHPRTSARQGNLKSRCNLPGQAGRLVTIIAPATAPGDGAC